jgi:predicted nucleotidyltransferase
MDQLQVEETISTASSSADEGLVAVYLFGSFARGTSDSASDVDIGILLRTTHPGYLNDLRSTLEGVFERALGRRAQVVVLNTAPPDLVHRVLRDGRLLVDRDRAARIRFEVQARNEYFDLLPILNLYRRREAAVP